MDILFLLLAVLAWLGVYVLLHACLKLQERSHPAPAASGERS